LCQVTKRLKIEPLALAFSGRHPVESCVRQAELDVPLFPFKISAPSRSVGWLGPGGDFVRKRAHPAPRPPQPVREGTWR
jgi:hypothetical protein